MSTKTCFKCGLDKPLSDFYAHKRMKDGHLNKCKECTKRDVQADYRADRAGHQEYEIKRGQTPQRKAYRAAAFKLHNERHPDRYKARYTLSNALRDGKIVQQPCHLCGSTEKVQAHHTDYSKPLDVEWVCFWCHRREKHGQSLTHNPAESESESDAPPGSHRREGDDA